MKNILIRNTVLAINILFHLHVLVLIHPYSTVLGSEQVALDDDDADGFYYDGSYYEDEDVHGNGNDNDDNDNDDDDIHMDRFVSFQKESFVNDIFLDSSMNQNQNQKKHHDGSSTFTLYLFALYEPGCEHTNDLMEKLKDVAEIFRDYDNLLIRQLGPDLIVSTSMPKFGKLNIAGTFPAEDNTSLLPSLFEVDEVPTLKFVMVEDMSYEELIASLSDDTGENDPGIYSLEYVGREATKLDIFYTVLHYWYRLIVSDSTEHQLTRKYQLSEEFEHEFDIDLDTVRMHYIPTKPLFSMSSMEELTNFLSDNAYFLFHTFPQDVLGTSEREEKYIRALMRHVDPVRAFIQCRKFTSTGKHTSTGKMNSIQSQHLSLFREFDELALNYLYRTDIAFFAVVSDNCDWIHAHEYEHKHDKANKNKSNSDQNSNGVVRILEISPEDADEQEWVPGAIFDSSIEKIFQPASTDEIVVLNMTQFAIVQSTPSILWYDRHTTATIAFPSYREIHVVLFIDVHSSRKRDGSYDYTSKTYLESCLAIALLHETTILHKQKRPLEDVVFMVVPSSETQIMKTFGIDFWSEMDNDCFPSDDDDDDECLQNSIPSLPTAIITSRTKSSEFMEVYQLPSSEMKLNADNCFLSGLDDTGDDDYYAEDSCNGGGTGGALNQFLDSYFDQTISPIIKSEEVPKEYVQQNYTLSSGVKVATTHSFEKMVLSEHNEATHSIVYFYSPSCGFCKRFDTTWHNLARLVSSMNWGSQISVIKIDISKNDLHLDGVNIQSVPAVYFFGKHRKDLPQKMVLEEDKEKDEIYSELGSVVDPTVILRWVMEMLGEDELKGLKSLATSDE